MSLEKEIVPYEEAVELEELGFNEPCFATYDEDRNFELQDFLQTYETFPSHIVAAPTFSQAFRWFREKYKIDSVIIRSFSMTNSYHYNIVIDQDYENNLQSLSIPDRTYEEAELACLRKLIEIVKNEK